MNHKTVGIAVLLSMQAVCNGAWASDGRSLYAEYRCIECHGADARTAPSANVRALAGMSADDIFAKAKRFVDNRAHDNATTGCGSPPSAGQIRAIADYLAGLPK